MCNSEMACRAITLCAPPIAVQAVRYGSKAVDHERLLLAKSRWSRTAAVGQERTFGDAVTKQGAIQSVDPARPRDQLNQR